MGASALPRSEGRIVTASPEIVVTALHTEDDLRLLISAAVNESHAIKESEPDRAARLLIVAHKLQRRLLTVKPIPWRNSPADVIVHKEMPAVTRFVDDYQQGRWPHPQPVVVSDGAA